MMKTGYYSVEELDTMADMHERGASVHEIAAALNRKVESVTSRMISSNLIRSHREKCPASVAKDRAARANSPHRNLTASLMGDPPKGYSALDKMENAHG